MDRAIKSGVARLKQPNPAPSRIVLRLMPPFPKLDMPGTFGIGSGVSSNQRFSAGRIITNAKRPLITQNAHSGASQKIG